MTFLVIIPARYASTRFPGKPLAMLGDKPVIQHVYEQAFKALDNVVVATDDLRIFHAVPSAIMTRADHRCGTDRCLEAMEKWLTNHPSVNTDDLVVINVQGDEPFIQPEQIKALCQCFDSPDTDIATLVRPFTERDDWQALQNPNTPKVVFNNQNQAILFSRSIIPYLRGIPESQWLAQHKHFRHIGMYAYRASVLRQITQLPPSPLELAESLEQLRWLENGYTIRIAVTDTPTIGIDTPDDLEQALQFMKKNNL